jgi:hypothetical protein
MRKTFRDFFQAWIERLRGRRPPPAGAPSFEAMLVRMAQATDETELSCDEVLALLDQFAEAELRGEDAARLMPLVQRHLERCGDCEEEHQALLRILRAAPAA